MICGRHWISPLDIALETGINVSFWLQQRNQMMIVPRGFHYCTINVEGVCISNRLRTNVMDYDSLLLIQHDLDSWRKHECLDCECELPVARVIDAVASDADMFCTFIVKKMEMDTDSADADDGNEDEIIVEDMDYANDDNHSETQKEIESEQKLQESEILDAEEQEHDNSNSMLVPTETRRRGFSQSFSSHPSDQDVADDLENEGLLFKQIQKQSEKQETSDDDDIEILSNTNTNNIPPAIVIDSDDITTNDSDSDPDSYWGLATVCRSGKSKKERKNKRPRKRKRKEIESDNDPIVDNARKRHKKHVKMNRKKVLNVMDVASASDYDPDDDLIAFH